MQDRKIEGIEDLDPRITWDVVKSMLEDPPPPLVADITFEVHQGGYEIWYSDRIANEHQALVDQSAEWLEIEMGVLNLGQVDYKVLMADGPLTDKVEDGLIAWWAARITDLDLS
jgi:hypothetical protein